MTGHWSKPIDFSDETMEQARAQLDTFRNALLSEPRSSADWDELVRVLDDDFNTPDALAVLHRWRASGATDELRRALELFGIATAAAEAPPDVRSLAEARQRARAERAFADADRLRAEIEDQGWEVRDVDGGFQLVPK
jgi:cysteinyl-tRNA synthetase